MEINKRGVILRRLGELLISCAILSTVATVLNLMQIIAHVNSLVILLVIFILFFWTVNIRQIRDCYYDLHGNKLHFKLNVIAHLIFAVINIAACLLLAPANKYIYTFLFAITKLFKYLLPFTRYNLISAILFNILNVLIIFIAHKGIRFKETYEDNKPPVQS